MPQAQTKTTSPLVLPPGPTTQTAVKAKEEGLQAIAHLEKDVVLVGTVTTEEDYLIADTVLGRIRQRRQWWKLRMYGDGKATPGIIPPLRKSLDALYDLNREVDQPLEKLELAVKKVMAEFKAEEARAIAAANQAKADEEARLRRLAEQTEAMAASAKTPKMKAGYLASAAGFHQQAEEVATQEAPLPVMAAHSGSRQVKRPRVSDILAFCAAIGDGTLPVDLIEVKQGTLNTYYREDPDGMAAWPGVTIDEGTQITGR